MTHRNRVAPTGEIVAIEQRGLFTGNRGCLHDDGTEVLRPWRGKLWITCLLEFQGRRLPLWRPRRWTPLFFYDEAVALAAGHRPCAFCRRSDYNAYRDAWAVTHGEEASASQMNDRLHADRLDGRHQRRVRADWTDLPDGVFVDAGGGPALVLGQRLHGWSETGYGTPMARPPGGTTTVLTPWANVEVLRAGYRPLLHPTLTA